MKGHSPKKYKVCTPNVLSVDRLQVIQYLGRYTHKVAITHQRAICVADETITFRYKDYHDDNKQKIMTPSQAEFVRRFEKHILPRGFFKIRSYGFLKHYNKTAHLNALRKNMNLPPAPPKVILPVRLRLLKLYAKDITRCPRCEEGTLIIIETIRPRYDHNIVEHDSMVNKLKC